MFNIFNKGVHQTVLINIQCSTINEAQNASEIFPGVLIGVTAKDYPDLQEGYNFINQLHQKDIMVSAGLGSGSADQWDRALQLAINGKTEHLNQIFPAAALSCSLIKAKGYTTIVNALVRPSGRIGYVDISTGPLSQNCSKAIVPIEAAINMLLETDVHSIKFFPMGGLQTKNELMGIARIAAKYGFIVEPTGGITTDNVKEIVDTILSAGVKYTMPHLYGSLKNQETGKINLGLVEKVYSELSSLF